MFQHAVKIGLIVAVLSLVCQDANALWHRGCGWGGYGCGWYGCGGYAGCGYGGCGYGGYAYGGGWYAGYGYGYPGYGYGVYAANPNGGHSATAARTAARPTGAAPMPAGDMRLTVNAPADAKVYINGRLTTSTGAVRSYMSTGLQPGVGYDYHVRAEFLRNGIPIVEEKSVQMTAGKEASLTFESTSASRVANTATPAQR